MYTATWNGKVIAKSDKTVEIEGNQYFPLDSVTADYLTDSKMQTSCPWQGTASYFNLSVDGSTSKDSAWTYKTPKDGAASIAGHVAFYRMVEVTNSH
jgi:uncharacterized protein (DUF427 family)